MKKIQGFAFCSLLVVSMSYSNDLFSQNIGIGIALPNRAKLEVQGAVDATAAIFGGETTGISLQRNWPAIGFNEYGNGGRRLMANGFAAVQYLDLTTGALNVDMIANGIANALSNASIRALSINNTGNIAIRTEPTNASLYVIRAGNFGGAAMFGGTNYHSYFYYGNEEHTYLRGGKTSSSVFLNDQGSNTVVIGSGNSMVGINSGNPTYTLEIVQYMGRGLILVDPAYGFVNWEYHVSYFANDGFPGQSSLGMYYNGQPRGFFRPNGQYSEWSDGRLKTNIKPLQPVLDRLNLLQASEYEMKDDNVNHEKTPGFIAQDVKPLFPELVSVHQIKVDSVNLVPDLHSLNYTAFTVVTIKALQEQYNEIMNLQKEQMVLLQRLDALDKSIR